MFRQALTVVKHTLLEHSDEEVRNDAGRLENFRIFPNASMMLLIDPYGGKRWRFPCGPLVGMDFRNFYVMLGLFSDQLPTKLCFHVSKGSDVARERHWSAR